MGEINHHGRPVEVGEEDSRRGSSVTKVAPVAGKDLVAVNEQVQLKALKTFYERADQKRDKHMKRLERCQKFTLVYNPLLALTFVGVYWIIGLYHAYSV